MKAARLRGIRRIAIEEVEEPQVCCPDDVLVGVRSVGICGSDVHNFVEGGTGSRKVVYPFIPGHEAAGEVLAVGSEVTAVKPGDRIMIEPAFHCGECDQCRVGRFNTCRKIQFMSSAGELQGCLCEKVVIPEKNCFKLPDGMAYALAALAEPLSIAVYSVKYAGILSADMPLAILGAGPIGLTTMLAARAAGAGRIYVTDRIDARVEAAAALGAELALNPDESDVVERLTVEEPLGMQAVFECCGSPEALDQAVELLAPGGVLILTGIPVGSRISLDIDQLRRKEITVRNVRRQNGCVAEALHLLASGEVDGTPLLTHCFPLDQAGDAFDLVAGYADGVIKAMIEI